VASRDHPADTCGREARRRWTRISWKEADTQHAARAAVWSTGTLVKPIGETRARPPAAKGPRPLNRRIRIQRPARVQPLDHTRQFVHRSHFVFRPENGALDIGPLPVQFRDQQNRGCGELTPPHRLKAQPGVCAGAAARARAIAGKCKTSRRRALFHGKAQAAPNRLKTLRILRLRTASQERLPVSLPVPRLASLAVQASQGWNQPFNQDASKFSNGNSRDDRVGERLLSASSIGHNGEHDLLLAFGGPTRSEIRALTYGAVLQ
jgi:hypothetical protein